MTIEEARYWLATTARQLYFCAQSGRSPLEMLTRLLPAEEHCRKDVYSEYASHPNSRHYLFRLL